MEKTGKTILVGVITGVLSTLAISLLPTSPRDAIFNSIKGGAVAAWNWTTADVAIDRWFLILLILLAAALLVILAVEFVLAKRRPSKNDYTADRLNGVEWRWSYKNGGPTDVWCYCPTCSQILVYQHQFNYTDISTTFTCENCSTQWLHQPGKKEEAVNRVMRQILRKLDTGEWLQVVSKKHSIK
ncbi:MAG TPA: hypothetical protein VGE67_11790 [Haloferula sp.]